MSNSGCLRECYRAAQPKSNPFDCPGDSWINRESHLFPEENLDRFVTDPDKNIIAHPIAQPLAERIGYCLKRIAFEVRYRCFGMALQQQAALLRFWFDENLRDRLASTIEFVSMVRLHNRCGVLAPFAVVSAAQETPSPIRS